MKPIQQAQPNTINPKERILFREETEMFFRELTHEFSNQTVPLALRQVLQPYHQNET